MKSWGEHIWEKKIREQDEVGVIHGTISSRDAIDKQTKEHMNFIDNNVMPLLVAGNNVLDVGVGPMARFSIEFAKRGFNVTGIDISDTTLDHAVQYTQGHPKITLIKADFLDYKDVKKYDLILCIETFLHVPAHCSLIALNNFNSLLNEGGYVLIDFAIENERPMFYELVNVTGSKLKNLFGKGFKVTRSFYTYDELSDMFERTHFKVVKRFKNLWLLQKTGEQQ